MAGISRDDLSRRLIESGLMSAETAERTLNRLPDGCDAATELVSQKLLTEFQASVLGSGELRTLVLGNYIVQEKLGGGGMGVVYLAKHRRMKRVVALKVLSAALTGDDEAMHRFQREVELLSRLQHPNIAAAYDADEANGVHFLVMEYVKGWDLRTFVLREGPLPVDRAVSCIRQAAQGLACAHQQGIIHRDVKPSNLLLDSSGTVKILDLGLARLADSRPPDSDDITETEITAIGTVMGTASYMAPEQGIDSASADERSDIYSLGCTLYFALTGSPPVVGDTTMQKILAHQTQQIRPVGEFRADVPEALCRIVERMTAKSPDDRYQSMEEVAVALAAVEAEESAARPDISADPDVTRRSPANAAAGRHSRPLFNIGTALLAGIVLIGIALAFIVNRDRSTDDTHPAGLTTQPETGSETEVGTMPTRAYTDITADFLWWDVVAFTADDSGAICGGGFYGDDDAEYPLVIWSLSDGKAERKLEGPTSWVWCGDVSTDRQYVLAGTGPSPAVQNGQRPGGINSEVFVWNLESGDLVSCFRQHGDTVRAAAFLPDGTRAVSGGYDGTLRLWSTTTAEELHAFENPSGEVLSVAASSDGRWIASGHWNGVELWDVETLAWDRQYKGAKVLALAFSDDARYLAIGDERGVVRVLDLNAEPDAPGIVAELPGHQARVRCLAWLPDGRRLISSSDDERSIRLWNVPAQKQISWFEGGDREVKSIAVTRDGRQALAACADATVELWDLPPESPTDDGAEEQTQARTGREQPQSN